MIDVQLTSLQWDETSLNACNTHPWVLSGHEHSLTQCIPYAHYS